MKTVLLITERFEPIADLLIAELRRRSVPCVRWNLDQFPIGSTVTYRASNSRFGVEVVTDGRRVDIADVGSIWCRGFQPIGFPGEIEGRDRKFVETEARRALDALTTVARPLWINHPLRHVAANSKPAQLFMARQVGLDIPPTIVTNDPDEVRSFQMELEGQVVYKSLSQALELDPEKSLFTGLVTDKELASLDLIRLTPGIFQKRLPKSYEVRATVVGSRIFSAKIDSQAHEETKLDWRHRPFEIDYQPIELPSEVKGKIYAFMEAFGLAYGAIDFIVTPDGRHVFLEVNPTGQYIWIESITGLEITAALADVLGDACRA